MKKLLLILSMLAFVGASGQISQTFKNVTVNDTLKTGSDSILPVRANLIPTNDSCLNLGTDSLRWDTLFVDVIDANVITGNSVLPLTVSQAQALIATEELIPGTTYAITDATSANGGSGIVYVKAATNNSFSKYGIWGRPTDLKAFGWIDVTAMIAGNDITNIDVNGVNQLSGTITFNTSINNTVSLAAANINANGSATVTAYAVRDRLILINKIATNAVNTHVIAGAGTATFDNEVTMDYGQLPDTIYYDCDYDVATDEVYACYDPINNIRYNVTSTYVSGLGMNPIYTFRWEDNSLSGANPWTNTYIENQDLDSFFYRVTDLSGSVYKAAATVALEGTTLINSYISRANFISGTYSLGNMTIRGISTNYLEIYEGEFVNSTVTASDLTSSGRWLFPRNLNAATVTCTGLSIGVSGLLEMTRATISAASTLTLTNVTITNTKISLKEVLLTQNSTIDFTGSSFNGGEFAGSSSEIINNSTLTLTSMTVTANFQFNSNKIGGRSTLTFTGSTISTALLFQYNIVGGNTSLNYTNLVTGVHAFTFTGNILNGTTINNTGTTMTGALSYTNAVYTLAASLLATPGIAASGGGYTTPGNTDITYTSRGLISFTATGRMRISNSTANDFDRLQLGGTTTSFPSLKREGKNIHFKLADDSDSTSICADTVFTSVVNTYNAIIASTPTIAVGATGLSLVMKDESTKEIQSTSWAQGVYLPVDSAGSNVDGVTPDTAFYTRVGNVVTVSGVVEIDPTTTATPTFFYMNLPVFPANWNTNRAGGTFAAYIVNESGGIIMGGPTSVIFQFNPTATGANNFSYTYSYRIE